MAEKGRAALKTERTNTYKAGVLKGTTVANCFNFMESIIDSAYNKVDDAIDPTKTFTTGGIATAYTVTDADVTANSFLDGKPFFIIFNVDNTGSATITFNALPSLDLKLVGETGKSDPLANQIKANVAYLATKESGVSEIYLRDAGSGSEAKVFTTGGTGTAYTVTDPQITANSNLDGNVYFVIFHTDSTGSATIQFNALATLDVKFVNKAGKSDPTTGTIKANVPYVISKETGVNEIYIRESNGAEINDAATNATETWSSNKIEDRAQKTLIPVVLSYAGLGLFTCSISHISVLGDLSNYFYCFIFDSGFTSGSEIQVNALAAQSIVLPTNSVDGLPSNIYLSYYDGTNFNIFSTQKNNDLLKHFYDGFSNLASIEGVSTGMSLFANTSDETKGFSFWEGSYTASPTNGLVLHPPSSTLDSGGFTIISDYLAFVPQIIQFPASTNNTYPQGNRLITANTFEEEFPPNILQNLTNGSTITISLKDGFLGEVYVGSSATRIIDFDKDGVSNDVDVASGWIILSGDNSCDFTFTYEGSTTLVMTNSGANPVTIPLSSIPSGNAVVEYKLWASSSGTKLYINVVNYS